MDLMNLSEEDALVLWYYGGYGSRESFPGARLAALLMLRGVNESGRKTLARVFASLSPHSGIRAVLALLRSLANQPAPIALPAPALRVLAPQRRCHRFTPTRAP
ncbi:hypothetical protein [Streptomyces sp. ISL-100]|uniref:hypothetical protein n=1 Tax=Streptomyces sp. ISL-100 TaxID=2819173 RepID=UPI001BE80758|nr:hypothetical protein [Streptomyces sp. ISL-100]MBT2395939.1 hypothetical protein [Streptomyces sp. ISL-100]